MQHDLERSLNSLSDLVRHLAETQLLAQIALDCVEHQVGELQPKLEVLLDHIDRELEFANEELPYRLRVVKAAIAQQSDRPEF